MVTIGAHSCFAIAAVGGDGANGERPAYRLLRYEEEWSFLRDSTRRNDPFDPIKFVPLSAAGGCWASFGGELREVGETYHHARFDSEPDWDGYLMHRLLLHGDLHFGESLRAFAELQQSAIAGRDTPARPTDSDATDVHQAFAELDHAIAGANASLRLGRQEMQYGSGRLVSVRNGPNVRLAFDAARFSLAAGGGTVDLFGGRPVEIDAGPFDDQAEDDRALAGIAATLPSGWPPIGGLDVYLLAYHDHEAEFARGAAFEQRRSTGARCWGTEGSYDWNFEAVGQWGSYGDDSIRAWTVASDSGWTWHDSRFAPRLGLKANAISGDHDLDDATLGTFNAMFPRGAYFGEIGIVGPANLLNLHPSIELRVAAVLTLTFDCVFFWRESVDDAVYGPSGNIVQAPGASHARHIGTQPSAIATWRIDRHTHVIATCTRFQPGEFLRESGVDRAVDFFRLELAYRF